MTDILARLAQIVLPRRVFYRKFYLQSDHWKRTAAEARIRAGHKCERCGAHGRLDCHHNSYDRLWRELPIDINVLCRACHNRLHRRRK